MGRSGAGQKPPRTDAATNTTASRAFCSFRWVSMSVQHATYAAVTEPFVRSQRPGVLTASSSVSESDMFGARGTRQAGELDRWLIGT